LPGPVTRTTNLNFFLARADQARVEAEAATLDHVRDRCRRSQAAWSALADKAQAGERLRIEDQKRKAATTASNTNEDNVEEQLLQCDVRASTAGTTQL
jgi:hypothetical protein